MVRLDLPRVNVMRITSMLYIIHLTTALPFGWTYLLRANYL